MLKNKFKQKIREFDILIDLYMGISLILLFLSLSYQSLDWLLYDIEPNMILRYPALTFGGIIIFFFAIAIMATKNHIRLKELENINLLDKNVALITNNTFKIDGIIALMDAKEFRIFMKHYQEYKDISTKNKD